jgi:hypothetical protein
MAISKKESRNISVGGHEFGWRASGSDEWITIIVWPKENEESRVVANVEYHHDLVQLGEGHFSSKSQLIVTSRIIRELILHVGVENILKNRGQLNIGSIEAFYDVSKAVRNGLKK